MLYVRKWRMDTFRRTHLWHHSCTRQAMDGRLGRLILCPTGRHTEKRQRSPHGHTNVALCEFSCWWQRMDPGARGRRALTGCGERCELDASARYSLSECTPKLQSELLRQDLHVDPCAELKAMLHCEVMSAFSDFSVSIGRDDAGPPWRCPPCPWRALSSHPRLLDHIRNKHTDWVKFVCSGTKQLKVIMPMYSLHSFTGRHPGSYLQRSSDLIRVSASPRGSATDNSIDRILRVVLTGTGPTMVHESTLCAVNKVRRVGNVLVPEHPKTMRTPLLCFSFWLVLGCCVGVPIPPL